MSFKSNTDYKSVYNYLCNQADETNKILQHILTTRLNKFLSQIILKKVATLWFLIILNK